MTGAAARGDRAEVKQAKFRQKEQIRDKGMHACMHACICCDLLHVPTFVHLTQR